MAALMFTVPEETSRILRELEVPGTRDSADHVTTIYLGEDIAIDRIGKLLPVLYEVTSQTLPFSMSTDHVGTFPAGDDGVPVIAHVDSPELHALRKALCAAMDDAGIDWDRKYPTFRPHTTLAYSPDPDTEFDLEFPEVAWSAHELLLWGSNRGSGRLVVKFPLSLPMARVASGLRENALQRAMVKLAWWSERDRFV